MTREQTTRLSPLRDRVAFVLATTRRLAKVNPDAAGSPFYQSLMPITLGNLPDSEASEVIRNFLKKMNMPYSKEIIDYIITLTGGHPYLLILTSIAMWDVNSSLKLRSGVTTSSPEAYRYILQGRLKDDFLRSFRIYWELLDDTEQSALKAFVDKEGTSIDKEMLSKLSPLYPKGLVRLGEKTGNYIFFTPLFRDFVNSLRFDEKERINNQEPEFTKLEKRLFEYLKLNAGRGCTYEELWTNVWNEPIDRGDQSKIHHRVQESISRLRRKLATNDIGDIIREREEKGYRFEFKKQN